MDLFNEYDLSAVLQNQINAMQKRIDKYTNDEIMANELQLLADNCFQEFRIDPLSIGDEEFTKRSIHQQKIRKRTDPFFRDLHSREYIEVDGIVAKFFYPYTGDDILFKCQASTFSLSGYPSVEITGEYIVFTIERQLAELQQETDKEKLMKDLGHDYQSILSGVGYVNNDVIAFNESLRNIVLHKLTERKKKVEQFYSISKMFEVPLKKSDFATTHIPLQRRIVPVAKSYNNEPIYCISEDEYKFILETIKHNGSTYERTPASYKSMQEEDLRNTLLAALNGMYQGNANGEAFRHNGKTDICIEKDNRAAFVAECKMWTGQATVSAAVKQLDGYLTWRDCKTALIYFVRNKDFLTVVENAKKALSELPTVRQIKELDRNEFECHFISESNVGQIIVMRVFLFNMYA